MGRLLTWLELRQPEVVALQELRSTKRQLPLASLANAGYHVEVTEHVALLSTQEISCVTRPTGDGRTIAGTTHGYRLLSLYAPNGRKAKTPPHDAKLLWFRNFANELRTELGDSPGKFVVAGDFNVAREPRDVWDPMSFRGRNLFTDAERSALDQILHQGMVDIFRRAHTGKGLYTWWNYAHNSFERNRGWRLDYMLVTPDMEEHAAFAVVDVEERAAAGTSDHAPIWLDLDLP